MNALHRFPNVQSAISDEQKQNIQTLITDLQNSVDGSLSDIDFSPLIATVQDAWSDRLLTADELEAILTEVSNIGTALGITAQEARTIFYDIQNLGQASGLPRTDDNLIGTAGNDTLWGGLGNDTLTGAVSSTSSSGEVDWLMGGGGSDRFVLGDATTPFYDDNNPATMGLSDYAILVDYNPAKDTIQLHGDASQYSLGIIPNELGVTGTAIFYKPPGQPAAPELVGVVAGVTLMDFSTGFAFV